MVLDSIPGLALIASLILVGGVLFSRLVNAKRTDTLPGWVMGIPLALLLVPAVLYVGARLVGLRISLSTIILSVLVILVAAYLGGRSPVPRKR